MGEANAQLDATISSLVTSQWEDIRSKLEAVQTEEEKQFRPNLETGIGRASPLNTIRLFDESNTEDDVRVVFYRDHASWCPYCHKVWLSVRLARRLLFAVFPASCAVVCQFLPVLLLALRLAPNCWTFALHIYSSQEFQKGMPKPMISINNSLISVACIHHTHHFLLAIFFCFHFHTPVGREAHPVSCRKD